MPADCNFIVLSHTVCAQIKKRALQIDRSFRHTRFLSILLPLIDRLFLFAILSTTPLLKAQTHIPAKSQSGSAPHQQNEMAEMSRANQCETESKLLVLDAKWLSQYPNPLIEFSKDDRVIAELDFDAERMKASQSAVSETVFSVLFSIADMDVFALHMWQQNLCSGRCCEGSSVRTPPTVS